MAEESSTKQFGLIDPKKNKPFKRPAIFNSDSEPDEQDKPTGITTLKKKERIAQQKAINEDPTIYQYDELFEDIQNQRKESKLARKDLDKKPKYINKLLESAERRKRENERRIERQVQKEREEEGDMFKDKESFVTSAYKKKLEEMKELDDQEVREDYLEAIGDVRKQGDLSGFYRHLYAQKVNFEEEDKQKDDEKPPETSKPLKATTTTNKRKYRKRQTSHSASDSDSKNTKLEHLPSNIDADSDFSIDSGGSESDHSSSETKKPKTDVKVEVKSPETKDIKIETKDPSAEAKDADVETKDTNNVSDVDQNIVVKTEPEVPKKPKINIWKKRTVEKVFDDALKRFYERKADRVQPV